MLNLKARHLLLALPFFLCEEFGFTGCFNIGRPRNVFFSVMLFTSFKAAMSFCRCWWVDSVDWTFDDKHVWTKIYKVEANAFPVFLFAIELHVLTIWKYTFNLFRFICFYSFLCPFLMHLLQSPRKLTNQIPLSFFFRNVRDHLFQPQRN